MKTILRSVAMTSAVLAVVALCVCGGKGQVTTRVAAAADADDDSLAIAAADTLPVQPRSVVDSLADALGVEVEAFLAVSRLEAGRSSVAFIDSGRPLVCLEVSMFKRQLRKAGYNVEKLIKTSPDAFTRPSRSRYGGSTVKAQWAMYQAAAAIDSTIARRCSYWGMYQIRGSNWKLCGTVSVHKFVALMSQSDDMQHCLFASFIKNTGLSRHLAAKNWARFARGYNGKGYAKRRYHIRLERAYNKLKAEKNKQE